MNDVGRNGRLRKIQSHVMMKIVLVSQDGETDDQDADSAEEKDFKGEERQEWWW